MAELTIGEELFTRRYSIDRALLVRYAGASGDFNPIHYNERVAREVGLDGVIAHGMATMGLAGAAVTDWAGDPGAVIDYGVRFTRQVLVPDPGEVELTVTGRVGALDPDARTVRVDLAVTVDGKSVLAKAQAHVRPR